MSGAAPPSSTAAAPPLLATAALLLAAPGPAPAQETTEIRTARRDLGRVERLHVGVEHAAGRITVGRADPGYLYRKRLRFDASRFEPASEWSREDGQGRLRLGLDGRGGEGRWLGWDGLDIDLNLDVLRDLDEASGVLELGLSRSVPIDLELQVGAAEADLRLGGIPLTSVRLETGASETRLSFDRSNPERMERLAIRAGVASLRATGLGNARFREMTVQGGAGDIRLDFTGEWRRDARASVDVGLGSLRLVFPEELGVRIRTSSFLSSFDAPAGFRRTDSGYESGNWSSAEHRVRLDVSAALGSVRVAVRD